LKKIIKKIRPKCIIGIQRFFVAWGQPLF